MFLKKKRIKLRIIEYMTYIYTVIEIGIENIILNSKFTLNILTY